MAAKKKQAMVVTVSGDRPIHEVARDLKVAGFDVKEVLDTIGVVTGAADPDAAKRARKVAGVSDVSADHSVDIGPPDADVS